jgi:hypothetical protein
MNPFVILAFMLCASPASAGYPSYLLHGIEMGQDVNDVRIAIRNQCEYFEIFRSEDPYLPVARDSQGSLVVHDMILGDGSNLDTVSFVFADDELVMIETTGGVELGLLPWAGPRSATVGRWDIHRSSRTIFDLEEDHAWILSTAALHPHLFLWSDPQLRIEKPLRFSPTAAIPGAFEFGGRFEDLEDRLRAIAMASDFEVVDEPWLPTQPQRQTQLNLYGMVHAGFFRKAEVVFGDDQLELVLILTGKAEEDRVRERLIAEFGEPEFVSDEFEAFSGWRVALRKDEPGILLLSGQLAPWFEQRYGSAE